MIELLAVAVVIIAVSSIISAILFSSLRGVSKTSVTDAVRQNGNSAISKISREIKFAKIFGGVTNDEVSYNRNCSTYGQNPIPPPIQYKYLKVTNLDNEELVFYCENGNSLYQRTGVSVPVSLFDTNTVVMEAGSCYFTCTQNVETDPPTVGIHFTLSQKENATFFERKASAEFQTSVTFRNITKWPDVVLPASAPACSS